MSPNDATSAVLSQTNHYAMRAQGKLLEHRQTRFDRGWRYRRNVHATTPYLASGAGLAVEGAVLAAELERAMSCETAWQEFMARRHERCRMIVESSVRLGDIEQGGGSQQEHQQLMRDSTIALAAAI
jgi:hypothetical protein